MSLIRTLKTTLRAPLLPLLWRSGVLSVAHRVVHRRVLTVFGLHRVLAAGDPRQRFAMPMWTISTALFADLLDFIGRHYRPVSIADVERAAAGEGALPDRAALLTFDDGWADTADTAMPMMRAAGIPGVVFVVSDRVDRADGFWDTEWYAALVTARAEERGRVWRRLCGDAPEPQDVSALIEGILRRLRREPLAWRLRALEDVVGGPVDQGMPLMVSSDDLRRLVEGDVAIGGHGATHEPLSPSADGTQEVARCARELGARTRPFQARLTALSYPHGRYDAEVVAAAAANGFSLQFTSHTVLNPMDPTRPWILGRVWADHTMVDARARLNAVEAAWMFFRSPVERLSGEARPLLLQEPDA